LQCTSFFFVIFLHQLLFIDAIFAAILDCDI